MSVNKKFLLLAALAVFIISCNNTTPQKKEQHGELSTESNTDSLESSSGNTVADLSDNEDIYDMLCQGWAMEDDVEALKGMDDNSKLVIPFRSFYFFADGSFLKNPRNAMEYGKWEYNDDRKIITLNYSGENGKDMYKIAALAPDELDLLNIGINTSTILKFISSGKRLKKLDDDPYYIGNNYWRIKPNKRESDADIQKRLKGNLHFFVLFYKDAIAKKSETVSFWGLPSCLKWYSGGIYLEKKEDLNEFWINCFYNKDQAMKAYGMMDKLLQLKYTWPKGETNWVKQNLAVLEQMYDNMDKIR
jgi:hypothetical protein